MSTGSSAPAAAWVNGFRVRPWLWLLPDSMTPEDRRQPLYPFRSGYLSENAIDGGWHFQNHLVGFQVYEIFILPDRIAGFLVPGGTVASATDSGSAGTVTFYS